MISEHPSTAHFPVDLGPQDTELSSAGELLELRQEGELTALAIKFQEVDPFNAEIFHESQKARGAKNPKFFWNFVLTGHERECL
eukprot:CAMPEP_0114539356 /NCGR_PEP_ID=MMETSP0114-20121206/193_1 /TAXON_ID=31324 /ORGANISM="Goniomonas sp, Strain m" /LENGTH=83 /DNA_ID=CAMNT_0001723451 /DNA_START=294 /DNA_END=545 /DNA_ORIENTATION=+